MKSKIISLTIGIPALNEEANIKWLLKDILKQNRANFILDKIIVISDGSTDNTANEVRKVKSKFVKLFENNQRLGLAKVQNAIIQKTNSDVLVIFNADIRLIGNYCIDELIKPIVEQRADLTSPAAIEAEPNTYFEKILLVSTKIKDLAYSKYLNGNNVYTCRGIARAFSRRFYKKISFMSSIGEDAFSYYLCMANKFKYEYVAKSFVKYRLPNNFRDHKKQSIRFFNSKELLKKEFGKRVVVEGYRLDPKILATSLIIYFFRNPIQTILYILVLFYMKLQANFNVRMKDSWDLSISSKKV